MLCDAVAAAVASAGLTTYVYAVIGSTGLVQHIYCVGFCDKPVYLICRYLGLLSLHGPPSTLALYP